MVSNNNNNNNSHRFLLQTWSVPQRSATTMHETDAHDSLLSGKVMHLYTLHLGHRMKPACMHANATGNEYIYVHQNSERFWATAERELIDRVILITDRLARWATAVHPGALRLDVVLLPLAEVAEHPPQAAALFARYRFFLRKNNSRDEHHGAHPSIRLRMPARGAQCHCHCQCQQNLERRRVLRSIITNLDHWRQLRGRAEFPWDGRAADPAVPRPRTTPAAPPR